MLKRNGFRDVEFKRRGVHAKASIRKSIGNANLKFFHQTTEFPR